MNKSNPTHSLHLQNVLENLAEPHISQRITFDNMTVISPEEAVLPWTDFTKDIAAKDMQPDVVSGLAAKALRNALLPSERAQLIFDLPEEPTSTDVALALGACSFFSSDRSLFMGTFEKAKEARLISGYRKAWQGRRPNRSRVISFKHNGNTYTKAASEECGPPEAAISKALLSEVIDVSAEATYPSPKEVFSPIAALSTHLQRKGKNYSQRWMRPKPTILESQTMAFEAIRLLKK